MKTEGRNPNAALWCIAVVALGTPLLHPVTSWMAKATSQYAVALPKPVVMSANSATNRTATREILNDNPNDFRLAFGAALEDSTSGSLDSNPGTTRTRLASLDKLAHDFPERPEALAALVRLGSRAVPVGRDDEQRLAEGRNSKANVARKDVAPDPDDLAWFDEIAARGEALEPDNAFFPAMRAVGLLAARRDTDAWKAVARAARCPRWKEYVASEVDARDRIAIARGEMAGSVARVARWAGVLLPHYASLRSVSRIGLGEAVRLETSGKIPQGIALRQDLSRIGGKMRRQGTSLIANLVGIAIDGIARSRPGGAARFVVQGNRTEEQAAADNRARHEAYGKWAEAHGKRGALAQAVEDSRENETVREILRNGLDKGPMDISKLKPAALEFLFGAALLANLIGVLVVGIVATLAARFSPIARGERLPAVVFASGLLGGALLANTMAFGTMLRLREMLGMFAGMQGGSPEAPSGSAAFLLLGTFVVSSAVGLTTAALFVRASLRRETSFSRTVVLGWRSVAPPLAAVLALCWAGLVAWSAERDARRLVDIRQMTVHEGRMLANLIGKSWPGDFTMAPIAPQ